jgi:proteic killer suppression protein
MIISFKDKRTQQLWEGTPGRMDPDTARRAQLKLRYVHLARELDDLRTPPGNRLEKLSGDRRECYSIRVNRQYRICFRWTAAGTDEVEFTDYH